MVAGAFPFPFLPEMPLRLFDDPRGFVLAFVTGLCAALLCVQIGTPLPWMIGPLFATAAARMSGMHLSCPVAVRQGGQWAIGTALGLYFTSPVLAVLSTHVLWIALALVFAIALGIACGWLLQRLSGVDGTTAFFAMAVGGASEMAVQGERHGAAVDRVAAAHSLRIMMVVAIIPFTYRALHVHGLDLYEPGARVVHAGGLLALVALTSAGALLLSRWNWPNVWVIGPLLVAIGLTAAGIHLSALPEWIPRAGQLCIGIALGTRFTPAFLHTAPRFLGSVALCTLAGMGVAAGFGALLAHASGIHLATAILATSPGGIAEMSLTAKTLELGVPIVTAFHVIRMSVLVLSIGPLFRLMRRWRKDSLA
jgi:membrane AbrB-like protein